MRYLPVLTVVGCAATVLVTCDPISTPNPVRHVSGYALLCAADANAPTGVAPGELQVAAYNPNTVYQNGSAQALETVTLGSNSCSMATGCPFAFQTIDFSRLTIGLLVQVGPSTSTDPNWATGYTWTADTNSTRAALDENTPVSNGKAYALSGQLLPTLCTITGLDAPTLVARGTLVGLVQGTPSDANSQADPAPVAGAVVNTDAAPHLTIYYANDTLTGPNNANATGARGVFVAVANSPNTVVNVWRVTPPTGDTTHRWVHEPLAGTFPGKLTVLALPAQ